MAAIYDSPFSVSARAVLLEKFVNYLIISVEHDSIDDFKPVRVKG